MISRILTTTYRRSSSLASVLPATILLCCASRSLAADDGPECFSKYTKTNVCDFARQAQATVAPTLPMQINGNVIIVSAVVAGPRLVFVAAWKIRAAEAEAMVRSRGASMDDWKSNVLVATRNTVCSQEVTAAFVRLGGQVQYLYKDPDGQILFSPLVDACPPTR
jgi:hypothetical protein